MAAISEDLSPLLMSEVVRADRLWDAVGHTIQRLDIWAPQVNMDLIVLCGDDTGACVCAVGFLTLPAVLLLWRLAEDRLAHDLRWLWRTGPNCYDLNGGVAVVRCYRA